MVEVINDLLGYDGLKIIQCPDMFHFSLDSSLLGDFVTINPQDKRILDIGTGNGPIPLFLSLKTKAPIDIAISRALKEKKKFNETKFVGGL